MGGFSKIVWFVMIVTPTSVLAQDCGQVLDILGRGRSKYYFVDSSTVTINYTDIVSKVRANDSSTLKLILQKGLKLGNLRETKDSFIQKGVLLTEIPLDQFYKVSNDHVDLTKKEKRGIRRIKRKIDKSISSRTNDAKRERLTSLLNSEHNLKLIDKMNMALPQLIIIYPKYTYLDHTLIMCDVVDKFGNRTYLYEICIQ